MEFRPSHFITVVSRKYPRLWALKGPTPLMLTDSTSSELSSQSVRLHQDFERSRNYQIGLLMQFTSLDIITLILKELPFHDATKAISEAFTYIKEQETKPTLVVNLTEDEISTRRVLGVWVRLTEMDKVKYPFKNYQNSINRSFMLNTITGSTTRFANDMFE
ncbi:hypothetical protein ACS0TY_032483 [Phlomoides rotata]